MNIQKKFIDETGLKYKHRGIDKDNYNNYVDECYADWLEKNIIFLIKCFEYAGDIKKLTTDDLCNYMAIKDEN
jgi:hypothetical protein